MNGDALKHILLLESDGRPAVWCIGRQTYEAAWGPVYPCEAWKSLDHAEEYGLEVEAGVDVIGLLRDAASACDERHGGQCGCGLLYGKCWYSVTGRWPE